MMHVHFDPAAIEAAFRESFEELITGPTGKDESPRYIQMMRELFEAQMVAVKAIVSCLNDEAPPAMVRTGVAMLCANVVTFAANNDREFPMVLGIVSADQIVKIFHNAVYAGMGGQVDGIGTNDRIVGPMQGGRA